MKFFSGPPAPLRLLIALLIAVPFLLAACNSNIFVKAAKKHEDEHKQIDDASIQKYLTTNNITQYQRTSSGLYLIPISDGSGAVAAKGQTAQVQYIGKFLNDGAIGSVFDSSYDNRTPCQCLDVLVGAGKVIAGWDEALQLMKKGDHKMLLIPSYLAYGPSGRLSSAGTYSIPPDQVLSFDMVINDIR